MTTNDFALAEGLIRFGLLREVNIHHLKEHAPGGAILCACGDFRRFPALFEESRGFLPHIHVVAMPGGSLILGHKDFANEFDIRLRDIALAAAVQELPFVFFSSHYPCGMATACGLGLRETLLKTLSGKKAVKENWPLSVSFGNQESPTTQAIPSLVGVLALMLIDWRESDYSERGITLYSARREDAERIRNFQLTDDESVAAA